LCNNFVQKGGEVDEKKFLNLIKNLQNIMRCPSCGAVYAFEQINFVGQQDGYFLLSMNCTKCSLPVWVNFFVGTPNEKIPASDLTYLDFELSQKEPITENEVIEFHSFVKVFDGDFKKHLSKKIR